VRRGVIVALAALGLGGCATSPTVDVAALTKTIGRDPNDVLREIGSAPDAKAASELAQTWREKLDGRTQLALLRFGLGSDDERVVFGAVVMNRGAQLAVPEMRNAASILIPRLADADCPVTTDEAKTMLGSVDIPAATVVLRKMPEKEATWLLGDLHRMVRADSVPSLCELSLATSGAVRRTAFENAALAARYSGEHTELVVATWLRIVGVAPDAEKAGLPAVLTTALRTHLDADPPAPRPAEGELDRRPPELPVIPCMRWLIASQPTANDLPLLQRVVNEACPELRHGALWALGSMTDADSSRFVASLPVDDRGNLSIELARARRGDTTTLETMLSESASTMFAGLTVASADRRRVFAEKLLAAPIPEAIATLRELRGAAGNADIWFAKPPYDDAIVADLEPLAATATRLDARVLRSLVACVPSCATTRLADALLARPANEIFAPLDAEGDPYEWKEYASAIGYAGAWPFLEVTRPDAFRGRLREGLRSEDLAVKEVCGALLLRIGTPDDVDALIAWIERPREHESAADEDDAWLLVAEAGRRAARDALRTRLEAATSDEHRERFSRALAVALGVDIAIARESEFEQTALLADDAALAFVRAATLDADHYVWMQGRLAAWKDDRVQQFAQHLTPTTDEPDDLARGDLNVALARGDRTALDAAMQLCRDGRYATHYGIDDPVRAHAGGLAMLPFWVSELGTNCCRAVVAEEVMTELFRAEADANGAQWMEPASVRLQRTLLPKIDRLRWSRIANAYVIAGN